VTATPLALDASSVTGRPTADGALIERAVLGPHTGTPWLEQSVLELDAGRACTRTPGGAEEVLFVLCGHGELRCGSSTHALEPETGAHLPPGQPYELSTPPDEQLLLVSVRIPSPGGREPDVGPAAGGPTAGGASVRRLTDQLAEAATASREFRIIFDPASGLASATHFVGYIPPGRAPDHFHTYDEVIYVLEGEGAFHAGGQSTPVGPGSCIALPARTVHCLENRGGEPMRVVAVFRPAGSPAAAYYPDGTPAFTTQESTHEEEVEA
jgi:mannose-6-phosphate isomerase-like protein (cupin superfamily)